MDRQELLMSNQVFAEYLPHRHVNANLELVSEEIRHHVQESIESLLSDSPKGLLLIGDVGCGKTSILAIVFKEYIRRLDRHIQNRFQANIGSKDLPKLVTHGQMINCLRKLQEEDEFTRPTIPKGLNATVLLIDDFGRGYDDKSKWNLSLQEEFIDYRWKGSRPTFITTNLSPAELRSWRGWERIVDRIADPDWMTALTVPGSSRRRRSSEQTTIEEILKS